MLWILVTDLSEYYVLHIQPYSLPPPSWQTSSLLLLLTFPIQVEAIISFCFSLQGFITLTAHCASNLPAVCCRCAEENKFGKSAAKTGRLVPVKGHWDSVVVIFGQRCWMHPHDCSISSAAAADGFQPNNIPGGTVYSCQLPFQPMAYSLSFVSSWIHSADVLDRAGEEGGIRKIVPLSGNVIRL